MKAHPSPNPQQNSRSRYMARSSRGIKIVAGIGMCLEIVLVTAIVLILINEGPGNAVTTLTICASIVAILSAIPAFSLAYVQWAHPRSPEGQKVQSTPSGKTTIQQSSAPQVQLSHTLPATSSTADASTIITPAAKGQQLIMTSPVHRRPLLLISYNDNDDDLAWAKWIDTQLKQDGYPTILRANLVIGTNTIVEMDEALRSMRHAIAVISPDYVRKSQEEWAAIFRTDPLGQDLTLIPVYVRDSKAELARGFLGSFKAIDLVGKSAEEARQLLLEEIHRSVDGYSPPKPPPPFPGKGAKP